MDQYSENQKETIREALRHTELSLLDLQGHIAASETRAYQLSAACVLIATLLGATSQIFPNSFTAFVGALFLVFCGVWSAALALPRKFYIRGHSWDGWSEHVDDDDDFWSVLVSQASENSDRYLENTKILDKSAARLHRCFVWSVYSLIFVLGGQLSSVTSF